MKSYPLPRDFNVDFEALDVAASGLNRPECVLASADGNLIAAHGAGGYSVWREGQLPKHVVVPEGPAEDYIPNGIALGIDGAVIFANLGRERGGIYRIDSTGSLSGLVTHMAGEPLPPTNFVLMDNDGAVWFTVSTRRVPRTDAWRHHVADGFIGVHDAQGTRIVADGIGYTNEIAFSPDGKWVYVNETYNQRVSRFALLPGRRLGPKEVVHVFGGADFPDGLCFDAYNGLWITCVGSNRVVVIRPDDGNVQTVLQDTDTEYATYLAKRIVNDELSGSDMATAAKSRLKNVSSLVFGGPHLKRCYLGSLLGDTVFAFDSPLEGAPTTNSYRTLR